MGMIEPGILGHARIGAASHEKTVYSAFLLSETLAQQPAVALDTSQAAPDSIVSKSGDMRNLSIEIPPKVPNLFYNSQSRGRHGFDVGRET